MKKILLSITFSVWAFYSFSQTCSGASQLTLLGKKGSGGFYQLHTNTSHTVNSDVSQTQICVAAWTCNSIGLPICNWREILQYKLSQIPTNAYIISAKLYLYAKVATTLGLVGSPTLGPNNEVAIRRVITPWDTTGIGIGWATQPQTTNENMVLLPASTSVAQDYIADVTNLVQYWTSNPDSNFGMQLKLIDETYYKSMIFHSGTSVDAVKPRLEICYFTEEMLPKVYGKAFFDANNNGIKDSTELIAAYVKVQLSNGSFTFTDTDGYYELATNILGNYDVNLTPPNFYTAPNITTSFSFNRYDTSFENNFALQATSFTDSANVHIIPFHQFARPGFALPFFVEYENLGNTVLIPNMGVAFDSAKVQYDSCSNHSFISVGSAFGGTVGSIRPGERHYFTGYLTTKPTVSLTDSILLSSAIGISPILGYDEVNIPVRGSFDPNDKEATAILSPAQVALGKYIDYTIRFENTGTDTAFNIVLKDTLSSLLQAGTLQMISSSHLCKATVNGRFVKFEFKNIKLLYHSLNEFKSMGFVKFRVKPITTLTNGAAVNNRASIYFDFNEPIVTNVAVTKITTPIVTPLKIVSYEATPQPSLNGEGAKSVLNKWTTTNEVNVSNFGVQRSADGKNFVTIGKVEAKNKTTNEYQFNDELRDLESSIKNLYYRLQMVDKDGKMSYSVIKEIRLNQLTNQLINIYPNPAKNEVTIDRKWSAFTKENIVISDVAGKVVSTFQLTAPIQKIDIDKLTNGVYIMRFENGERLKLIKQ